MLNDPQPPYEGVLLQAREKITFSNTVVNAPVGIYPKMGKGTRNSPPKPIPLDHYNPIVFQASQSIKMMAGFKTEKGVKLELKLVRYEQPTIGDGMVTSYTHPNCSNPNNPDYNEDAKSSNSTCFTSIGDVLIETQADIEAFNYCSINGNLIIKEISTAVIKNLSNLTKLKEIKGDLIVQNNTAIRNLDELSNLITVGGKIEITTNSSLSNACGIMNLLNDIPTVVISKNGKNTNSKAEIIEFCVNEESHSPIKTENQILPSNNKTNTGIQLYPNPVKDKLYLTSDKNMISITVVDYLGQVLYVATKGLHTKNYEMLTSSYPSGVYFVQIRLENDVTTIIKKIVVE